MQGTNASVLICGSINFAHQALANLRTISSVTLHELRCRDSFLDACRTIQPRAIYRPLDTSSTIGPFDATLVNQLPTSVKFIAHNGAGFDQIDIEACRNLGIQVSNTPGVVSAATADTAFWLMLSTLRKYISPMRSCQEGLWKQGLQTGSNMGKAAAGKTVGIIGLGGIGRMLAKRCIAFDMSVQYYNRTELQHGESVGAKYSGSLEHLLKTSDVVSINLPLNKLTRHLISYREFGMMKDGAILINTARGPIVNEEALVHALNAGKLSGVGLDVYENEPVVHEGLLRSNKVVLLPHIGTVDQETQKALEELVINNIMAAIKTGELLTPIQHG